LFTDDLEELFKANGKKLDKLIEELEDNFLNNRSIRAGTLLSFYYLIGNYKDPEQTKDLNRSH